MESRKTLSVSLLVSTLSEIRRIARDEGRNQSEVARLLLKVGLRSYRRGRPLLCGYPDCTRKDCCGGEALQGRLVTFPTLRRDH